MRTEGHSEKRSKTDYSKTNSFRDFSTTPLSFYKYEKRKQAEEGEAVCSSHCVGIMRFIAPLLSGITLSLDMSAMEFADTGQLCFYGPLLMGQLIIACACLLIQL